jgi:hypothetical protein
MGSVPIQVLLVGENGMRCSSLAERLKQYGCECRAVSGCLDGARLVSRDSFDLVLCSGRLKGFQTLVAAARSSSASLFRYLLVEDGCWWVPTVFHGDRCSRAPAFRDAEMAKVLDAIRQRSLDFGSLDAGTFTQQLGET